MTVASIFLFFSLSKYNDRVHSVGAETFASITETTASRVETQLEHYWKVLDSFSAFLHQKGPVDEEELLYYMSSNTELWDIKEVAIRTETGRHFNSWGNEFFLDETTRTRPVPTSDTWISHSNSMYLIHPLNTRFTFRGEQIQIVSVSISICDLFHKVRGSEFNGNLQIFFADSNGNRLNNDFHQDSITADNLISLAQENQNTFFMGNHETINEAIAAGQSWIGTVNYNGTELYMGFVPMTKGYRTFYLVTAVESKLINEANTSFGEHVMILSLLLIVLSMVVALLSFLSFHRRNNEYVENVLQKNRQDSNEKLEAALELAQQSNAAKTAFLSSMSHDIRTPMNAIINMTDFAINEIDNKVKVLEYLRIIHTSSTHLLNLINDVLDMTHIESGKMILKHEPFSLSALTSSVSSIISAAASKKKISFSPRIISITHDKLRGDELRLQQVLINLLNNAVKFTPEGGTVVLTIEEIPSLKHNYQGFQFTITDTGCGIPAETIDRIFEPFSRIEGKTKKIEGNGLGLAITKSIVDAMNGEITVQSTPDVGSIFTVRMFFEIDEEYDLPPRFETEDLPEAVVKEAVAANPQPMTKDFNGIRVLVAEDIAINQQILEHLMQNVNIRCDFANNGREAVEKFTKSDPFWYSLIFMDIQMPEMNGYEATKQIRLSSHAQSDIIPIVAMTANVFDEDVDRCRVAGMNGHLGKPIDPEVLVKTIESFLQQC